LVVTFIIGFISKIYQRNNWVWIPVTWVNQR